MTRVLEDKEVGFGGRFEDLVLIPLGPRAPTPRGSWGDGLDEARTNNNGYKEG